MSGFSNLVHAAPLRRLSPRRVPRQAWITAATVGVLTLFVLLIWLVPEWQGTLDKFSDTDARAKQVDEYRRTIAQIVGGALLLVGGYFTYRQLGVAQENLKATQQNLKATEDKQITERFAKAIEQLGNDQLELRLGGIYALERIAQESERDYWPIMEVLTAYVRTHAPRKLDGSGQGATEGQGGQSGPLSGAATNQASESVVQAPDPTVQAILTVLGRRTSQQRVWNFGKRLDLRGADLRGADLRGADLREANLRGADLREADLRGATLNGAVLSGATLDGVTLSGATLSGADLNGATLIRATLNGATLIRATLIRATLNEAHLIRATLNGADLNGATLIRATLNGAHFHNAHLRGADLRGADLEKADLAGAILEGAVLDKAALRAVQGLTDQQLATARGDGDTKLPDGMTAPPSWAQNG